MYAEILNLVGEVPYGFEGLAWVISAVILVFLLQTAFSVLFTVCKWLGGGRR